MQFARIELSEPTLGLHVRRIDIKKVIYLKVQKSSFTDFVKPYVLSRNFVHFHTICHMPEAVLLTYRSRRIISIAVQNVQTFNVKTFIHNPLWGCMCNPRLQTIWGGGQFFCRDINTILQ